MENQTMVNQMTQKVFKMIEENKLLNFDVGYILLKNSPKAKVST